ncbi:MAG TPA: radical SAM protein [Gammaproteobacteria bacterium]|nr:radical SAM protein [Gammaproteobacteria bacterium]
MNKLSSYYKLYKLIGPGRNMRILLDMARLIKMRYLVVRFDPNWMCNLRCRMCYFSGKGYEKNIVPPMDIKLFDKIAADLFPKTRILFMGCGAEPLMSPQFADYLDTIGNYSIPHVNIVSNGQLLTEKIVSGMVKNRINQLIVSMDGFCSETYESIRTRGNFKKLLDNLKMLKEIKENKNSSLPVLRINFTAMKKNYTEIAPLIEGAKSLGISVIRVRPMAHWGGALNYNEEILTSNEYNNISTELFAKAKRHGVELLYKGMYDKSSAKNIKNPPPSACMYPWYTIQIRGDGKIRFCPYFDYGMGDMNTQSFKEFLKSNEVKSLKYNLSNNTNKSCMTKCNGNLGGL